MENLLHDALGQGKKNKSKDKVQYNSWYINVGQVEVVVMSSLGEIVDAF